MVSEIKRLLVGQPLDTAQQHHQRLSNAVALAVFSSDALSSVAYATEAILLVLIAAGSGALPYSLPIAGGIAVLLLIVGFSYRQTIHTYPQGGGAYLVSHQNLGELPGLIAAASLLIDYVLTVAVSVSAGVAAITSLADTWGFPQLADYRVDIALICIAFVTLINLRGVKESGLIFAVPTYMFVVSMLALIAIGIGKVVIFQVPPVVPQDVAPGVAPITFFLILQAFSAGCTALTGVEAISDGVPAFKVPESRNAARTLMVMIGILGTMFLGITVLGHFYGVTPREHVTVVSEIAREIVGEGPFYFVIQVATAVILVLAANTAFADFPRLSSLLSRDRYLPRQFSSRGDRLVFSNGIIALGAFAALLVVIFNAREQAMLPLYAIGVFISFTLSQSGMVMHWTRTREPGWRHSRVINGIGAVLTFIVLMIIIATRFVHGAWMVLLLMPMLVVVFLAIHKHYREVARQLSLEQSPRVDPIRRHTALVLVSGVHRGVIPALEFARSIAPDNVTALYVDMDIEATNKMRAKWDRWGCGVPLVILPSPFRSLVRPILHYIDEMDARYDDDVLSVILPEFIPSKWWQHLLHNQTALLIKAALLFRKGVVVVSVPYHLDR